jgi:type I restriction-modification system DNA methylase subunit
MGLFQVLDSVFDAKETDKFRKGYNAAKKKKDTKGRVAAFKYLANKFAEGAAKEAGSGVVKVLKAQIGIV